MPRVKKSRFTKKSTSKGGGRWPAKVPVVSTENANDEDSLPLEGINNNNGEALELTDEEEVEVDEPEVEIEAKLPMMFCVVCYNEFTYYSLNCISWETAMAKDFYVALDIPCEEKNVESITSLPFCPECHSKVSVMFSVHQQLKSVLQSFNCARNDLAFTIVETIDKNCRNGPLDLIRKQIFDRWKDLHAIAKEKGTSDIFEAERDDYLDPALNTHQEWPSDHKSMALAADREKRNLKSQLQNNSDRIKNQVIQDTKNSDDVAKPYRSPSRKGFKIAPFKSKAKKLLKVKKTKERGPRMPKLEPMEKLPSKPASPISTFRKPSGVKKVNGTTLGHKGLSSKSTLLKHTSMKGKIQRMKKITGGNAASTVLANFTNRKVLKKSAIQLVDGSWKCPYCPKICPDLSRIKRHESLSHPNTRPLTCKVCKKGFSTALTLRRHLQVVHKQGVEGFAKCPYCDKLIGKKHAFELHIKSAHKGKSIPEYLPAETQPKMVVKIPMTSPPSPEITDLQTSPRLSSSPKKISSLKRKSTMKSKIPSKKEKTEDDKEEKHRNKNGSQESSNSKLSTTVATKGKSGTSTKEKDGKISETNDSKSIKSYICLTCQLEFATEGLLKSHAEICNDVSNQCNTCDEEFSTESELRVHRQDEHGSPGAECPVCGKWFPKPQSLGGHMHLHKREGVTWEKSTRSGSRKKSSAPSPEPSD